MRRAHGFNIKMPWTGLSVSAELLSHSLLHFDAVKEGVKWSVLVLVLLLSHCSSRSQAHTVRPCLHVKQI